MSASAPATIGSTHIDQPGNHAISLEAHKGSFKRAIAFAILREGVRQDAARNVTILLHPFAK